MTDVGSVKAPVVAAVDHPRFVGGHPMAGSEAIGVDGARARPVRRRGMGAHTRRASTDQQAHALVHSVVRSFGADVLTLAPDQHDRLVATVSHVPHLTAAALMQMAAARGESDAALLRLAAGGFRDMTRIAAGDPGMWLDVCAENREAIVEVLDELMVTLGRAPRGRSTTATRSGWSASCAPPSWPGGRCRSARRRAEQLGRGARPDPRPARRAGGGHRARHRAFDQRLRRRGRPQRRRARRSADPGGGRRSRRGAGRRAGGAGPGAPRPTNCDGHCRRAPPTCSR